MARSYAFLLGRGGSSREGSECPSSTARSYAFLRGRMVSLREGLSWGDLSCCCCITTIFIVLLVFILAYFSHPTYPTFSIEEFHIPVSNNTTHGGTTQIYFGLKIHNDKVGVGLHYDHLNLMFSYLPNKTTTTSVFLGNYSVPPFDHGNEKTIYVKDVVETNGVYSSLPFVLNEKRSVMASRKLLKEDDGVFLDLNKLITKVFRVDLVAQLRFNNDISHHYRIVVGARVEVDDQTGEKVNKKGIKLGIHQ